MSCKLHAGVKVFGCDVS